MQQLALIFSIFIFILPLFVRVNCWHFKMHFELCPLNALLLLFVFYFYFLHT